MKTFILTLAVLFSTSAFANPGIKKAFTNLYPTFKGANCKICHTSAPQLNPYGIDLQKANQDFKAIEAIDSDGDGFSNIDEINASSNPGNKDSTPAHPVQ